MSEETTAAVEATVREICRKTRKKYSAKEKVRTSALVGGASVSSGSPELPNKIQHGMAKLANRFIMRPMESASNAMINKFLESFAPSPIS